MLCSRCENHFRCRPDNICGSVQISGDDFNLRLDFSLPNRFGPDGPRSFQTLDGSFKVNVRLKAIKNAKYKIELFAADTALEGDGGPNYGLVDQTKVIVPHDRGKGKDDKKKKKKKKK
jgi:hypothetical protein